ncbi:MAG: toll/interleukin-1 receptor domain-containing protein [Nitrospira sp.]|nr:toll/interleukin-1 receptor domain-containing protein [Nitrospira sp.]
MQDFQRIFADHHPQPGYCLVLRPFNDPSDHAWAAIKQKLEHTFRWTDIKDLSESGTIMDQILTEIARTDVVIVDITGNNPNVFFELGIARTAKSEKKILLMRREGDEDDRLITSNTLKESVVPFDVRSDRYLSFRTTNEGIDAMLPTLTRRLWDALEKSQWFLISKGEVFPIGPLESDDGLSTFMVYVQPTQFLEQGFGPKAGKVHVEITLKPGADRNKFQGDAAALQPIKKSLGYEETMDLGFLPWRLKFHKFESDKARFCLEPTGTRK